MKCGLVILNYNDFTMTQSLVDSIRDFPEINHVVIVDNNSPNESYEVLKKCEGGKITVIQSGRNGGYSFGNNVGIRYLIKNYQPDIIGIANPDTIFTDSFVRRIKELFAANPDYAVITGLQLNADNDIALHPFWEENESKTYFILKHLLYHIFLSDLVYAFRKIFHIKYEGKYRAYCEKIKNSPRILNQVWAVEGSLFFIRTKDFERIGLFDEQIFMFYEENIIAEKFKALGRKIGVANDITYIHDHSHKKLLPVKHSPKKPQPSLALNQLEKATVFYYSGYHSENKVLRVVLIFLLKAVKLKVLIRNTIIRTIKAIIHK